MTKLLNQILTKTHLDGGIAHAVWMLRYNTKVRLMKICFKLGECFYNSITKQSNKRAIRDLATIKEQEQLGIYTLRETKEFLESQKDGK